MTRRLATAFEQRCRALLSPERPRRIVVGEARQRCREFCGIGLESLPTVAVEVEHHGSCAQDVLDAGQVLAGHRQHHVDQFLQAESLPHHRAHAQVFGFLFGVADEDGLRQRHKAPRQRVKGKRQSMNAHGMPCPYDFLPLVSCPILYPLLSRSRTRSLSTLPSTVFPSSASLPLLLRRPSSLGGWPGFRRWPPPSPSWAPPPWEQPAGNFP